MTPLRAFLAAIAPYAIPVLLLVMVLASVRVVQYEQELGALKIQLHQLDSTHAEAVSAAAAAGKVAEGFKAAADSLNRAAQIEVRKDRAVQQRTDSTVRASADERERARAVLADSLAGRDSLRAEIVRLLATAHADSLAGANERRQHQATVASLLATVHADSLALAQQTTATQAEMRRALLAEQQVSVLRKQVSGTVQEWTRAVVYIAVGVGATKLLQR